MAIFLLFGLCCFYLGVLVGAHTVSIKDVCSQYITEINELKQQIFEPRFPDEVASFAAGMALVARGNFTEKFDTGVPLTLAGSDNQKVLILYSHKEAMPRPKKLVAAIHSNNPIPTLESVDTATENCDVLNIILAQPGENRQCFAMMGQYRSYHIQKFMRLPEKEGQRLNHKLPLRYVNRGAQYSGRVSAKHPSLKETKDYWDILKNYLNNLDTIIDDLRPVAMRAAKGHNDTIIVMVCNYGQVELLMNFVCTSKARGMDLSGLLVFATDQETKRIVEGLGLHVFFDEINYGDMPKDAAKRYGDETFTRMMMAKVYCVQQIMDLGYDVLFQDVDMVWYRNPLEFFHSGELSKHEMFFQDDGSRGIFYAPYSANTGLYYVRNNARTRYFFNSLLLAGDLISSTHSHQIALVSLLAEHASMHGLRVKVLSRETEEFPGGFAFHNRPDYMKQVMKQEIKPYLLHMSWTANKMNKEKFFRQTGNWYLKDKCLDKTLAQILDVDEVEKVESGILLTKCCDEKPLVMCHFRDKPSVIPCKRSPSLDEGKPSFW